MINRSSKSKDDKMNDEKVLPFLENELRKTEDIIKYLEYQLMGKRAFKRETKFRIAKVRGSEQKEIQ